ncbi:MAG: DUF1499 domain-containing protein [Myxococcota bacterium]
MSRIARIARGTGALAALLFLGGPLANQTGAVAPLSGFYAFMLGGLLGVLALLLGAIGLLRTRASSGRAGRGHAWTGFGIGAAILAVVVVTAGPTSGVPPIHDITTDVEDPPLFTTAPEGRPELPPEGNAALQREAYPDLAPIQVESPPAETVARVAGIFRSFGWEVTREDAAAGVVEGNETSRIFRFVDDVVVRVKPAGGGSRVDIRSRSRVGQSDLGANAARIRRIREALTG